MKKIDFIKNTDFFGRKILETIEDDKEHCLVQDAIKQIINDVAGNKVTQEVKSDLMGDLNQSLKMLVETKVLEKKGEGKYCLLDKGER